MPESDNTMKPITCKGEVATKSDHNKSIISAKESVGGVDHLNVTASYRTSYRCPDGSYPLISGEKIILEFDFGKNLPQLRSFQLQEVSSNLQPMFEYESSTGKSSTNRVESCEWTDTGIKLKIPDMNMEMDSHTYACSASIWQGNKPQTGIGKIEIKGIVDPPAAVNLTTPAEEIHLKPDFGQTIINPPPKPFNSTSCSPPQFSWTLNKGHLHTCPPNGATEHRAPGAREHQVSAEEQHFQGEALFIVRLMIIVFLLLCLLVVYLKKSAGFSACLSDQEFSLVKTKWFQEDGRIWMLFKRFWQNQNQGKTPTNNNNGTESGEVTEKVKLSILPRLCIYLVFGLSLIAVVNPIEIKASFKSPFECQNHSYALIGGADLTLEYEYGCNYTQLRSFHLYELFKGRHMFDYERAAGKAFMKDRDHRLKSFKWTNTGIKLTIPKMNKEMDLGKYDGDVDTGSEYKEKVIEVNKIYDPPTGLKVVTNSSDEEKVNLTKDFKKKIFEASAESYGDMNCNNLTITWVSLTKGNLVFCQFKDEREPTVCQLTLNETEFSEDECMTLHVYAEHYGVRSENKTFTICYNSTTEHSESGTADHSESAYTKYLMMMMMIIIIIIIIAMLIAVLGLVYLQKTGKLKLKRKNLFQEDGRLCKFSKRFRRNQNKEEAPMMLTSANKDAALENGPLGEQAE